MRGGCGKVCGIPRLFESAVTDKNVPSNFKYKTLPFQQMYACASSQTCKHNGETVINIHNFSFPGPQEPRAENQDSLSESSRLSPCHVALSRTLGLFSLEGLFPTSLCPLKSHPSLMIQFHRVTPRCKGQNQFTCH